jgi:hypothetical protein
MVIVVAICFSANAFAKDKLPKVGNKPLVLVKPKEPTGCKLVGTLKGTKLWAGDCVASELKGAAPAAETQPLSEQDIEAIVQRVQHHLNAINHGSAHAYGGHPLWQRS